MIEPHGGTMVDRVVAPAERDEFVRQAAGLPAVKLSPRQASDAEKVDVGAFSPLTGFIGRDDYLSVLRDIRLASGVPWSLPMTLAVEGSVATVLPENGELAREDEAGCALGTKVEEELISYDKQEDAQLAYGTADEAHPGVANVYGQGPVLLGGPLRFLPAPRIAVPSLVGAGSCGPRFRVGLISTSSQFATRCRSPHRRTRRTSRAPSGLARRGS